MAVLVLMLVVGRGEEEIEGSSVDVGGKLFLDVVEFILDSLEPLLEKADVAHTAINWLAESRHRFIDQRSDGILSLRGVQVTEHARHFACPKHAVHIHEVRHLIRRKVWCKQAIRRALSPQELAGPARRVR